MKSDFNERLLVALESQHHRFEPYKSLCEKERVTLKDLAAMTQSGDLHRIPAIPAEWFKRKDLLRKLADFKKKGLWLVSSATTGDPSYIWRTETDRQSVIKSFCNTYKKVPSPICLAFSPAPSFLKKIGKRFSTDEHRTEFYALMPTLASEMEYKTVAYLTGIDLPKTILEMVKTRGKGRPVLNLKKQILIGSLEHAEKTNSKILLGSAVLLLYPAIKGLLRNYDLGKNAYFLTGGGGWDGNKGVISREPIEKKKYVMDMAEKLGMPEGSIETNIWDTYGTAENGKAQPGSFSRDYGDFLYEIDDDLRLFVLKPTGGVAKIGETGFPKFISPNGVEGFPGASVIQEDQVEVVSQFDDGSVRQFTHVHRSSLAGCAIDVSDGVPV